MDDWASVSEGAPNMDSAYLLAKWRTTVQQVRRVRFVNALHVFVADDLLRLQHMPG